MLVVLAEWVMAVVLYGSKAKDTASRTRGIRFTMAAARRGGKDSG